MFGQPHRTIDIQDGLKEQQRRYVNICVVGQPATTADPASGTLCQYDATYPSAILDNPKEWVVGIDRFNIPMLRVPRFIDPSTTGDNPIATITVTNTAGPTIVGTYSQQVTINGVLTPDPFGSGYVYLATQWVFALQQALDGVFATMSVSQTQLQVISPLVTLNPATGLITMQVQAGLLTGGGQQGSDNAIYRVDLYFNQALWRYFPTFPQTFFNWSSSAAPTNTSNFYSHLAFQYNFNGTITRGVASTASALPNLANAIAGSVSNGILTTALVAGNSYTQLQISGGTTYYMGAGQAILLSDSASGTTQTVFVAEGDCKVGATVINTLLFTAVFAFPTTTTTATIYSITAIPVQSPGPFNQFTAYAAAGSTFQLGTGTTRITLSRPVSFGDGVIYITPTFTHGEAKNTTIVASTVSYDSIVTESPVPPIWTNISSVRVKSTQLPVAMEFSPDVLTSSSASFSQAPVNPMVTDFVIDTTQQLQTADVVQFVTENPRWIDLLGDNPMYRLDLRVYWVDLLGVEHPVYIPAGYRFDMKLNFKRKYTKCLPGF